MFGEKDAGRLTGKKGGEHMDLKNEIRSRIMTGYFVNMKAEKDSERAHVKRWG